MPLRLLPPAALALCASTLLLPAAAPPVPSRPQVLARRGDCPIIISAPHGGTGVVAGVEPRKGEGLVKGGAGFFAGRDTGTEELAQQIADEVEKLTGKKPYLVVSRFHRKYIDANRPPHIAYESPVAVPTYESYHAPLSAYCKEVQKTWGRGLLIDVHGQGSAKDTIFRGTKNGTTCKLLIDRFGEKAHTGPKSFFGLLESAGAKVFPETGSKDKERGGFTGGFIVQNYGSHQGYGIDAIQLEYGGDYRSKAGRPKAAKQAASAVAEYARLYLPAGKK